MNEQQYWKECHKLIEDPDKRASEAKDFIPVTKYARTYRYGDYNRGRLLKCPICSGVHLVYHFLWSASSCDHCKEMIEKLDYLMEVKND